MLSIFFLLLIPFFVLPFPYLLSPFSFPRSFPSFLLANPRRYLQCNPRERRVIINENLLSPSIFRESIAHVLLEKYQVHKKRREDEDWEGVQKGAIISSSIFLKYYGIINME